MKTTNSLRLLVVLALALALALIVGFSFAYNSLAKRSPVVGCSTNANSETSYDGVAHGGGLNACSCHFNRKSLA